MPHVTLTHDNVVEDFATSLPRACACLVAGLMSVAARLHGWRGALVRENRSIGPRALIGMGSVVL